MPPRTSASTDIDLFLDAVKAAAGPEGLLAIQMNKGGIAVRIPRVVRSGHWLARAIGTAKANAVCATLRVLNAEGRVAAHPQFVIPIGARGGMARARALSTELLLKGHGVREVALKVGVHERTVSRLRSRLVADGRLAPSIKRAAA